VMVAMRDGKRMAADVYRPKDASKKYGTIFVRTPYNFNYWDVRLRAPADMTNQLEAVKRGFAYVIMNERGHFFSEGKYDILLATPLTNGQIVLGSLLSRLFFIIALGWQAFTTATVGLLIGGVAAAPFGAMIAKKVNPDMLLTFVGIVVTASSGYGLYRALS